MLIACCHISVFFLFSIRKCMNIFLIQSFIFLLLIHYFCIHVYQ
nr:MAG TPA: hypothetical protein [Caudoviricetes sp.]